MCIRLQLNIIYLCETKKIFEILKVHGKFQINVYVEKAIGGDTTPSSSPTREHARVLFKTISKWVDSCGGV